MRPRAHKAIRNSRATNLASRSIKNAEDRCNWRRKEFSRRELRGLSIVAKGHMTKRSDENTYLVRSSDLEKWYKVCWNGKRWVCECKDHEKRSQSCKHVFAILFLSRLPYMLMANYQSEEIRCPKCNSNHLIRKGLSPHKEFAAQRYQCKDCNHKFEDKGDSKGLKGNPLAVLASADLYFKGLSLRAIQHHMKSIHSFDVSYPTIHRWIRRMIKKMIAHEREHSLNVGKRWHIDETGIKIDGRPAYLWNALDAKTKILLASEVTYGRAADDAEMVIREALRNARDGLDEIEVVTDGLKSYGVALTKDYGCRIMHTPRARFTGPNDNNVVERVNGTLKTRIRGFRRLDNLPSSAQLFHGFKSYYNSRRPHSALGGKTPIEASLDSNQESI